MSNEQSFINRSIHKNARALFVKRIDVKSSKEINESLKNFFFNPSTYFSTDSPIQVGKRQEMAEISYMRNKKGRRTTTFVNNMSSSSKSKIPMSKAEKEKERNQFIENNKFEVVDNKKLKLVFDSFKKRINSGKKEYNLKYNNSDLPLNMNVSLRNQQSNICKEKLNKKDEENLEKYLLKKSKKNKGDLIFNKIDNYMYKQEIFKNIENNKVVTENSSRRDWILSLRRPLKLKGIRRTVINVNTDKFPFYSYFIEKSNDLKITSVKPGINLNSNYIKKVIKNARISNSLSEYKINRLKNLDDIKIKGANLLDIEYKREMESQKKKILHKAIIDNGRIILKTEINNVFGKQTFYKNYDKNVYKPLNTSCK